LGGGSYLDISKTVILILKDFFSGSQIIEEGHQYSSVIDITGKLFFDDELYLYDYKTKLLYVSNINTEEQLIDP